MAATATVTSTAPSVGALLQYWRKARHLSQLALANEADVSPRHVCFLETGRARPSREMVLLLATVLDVPLRERNALLLAAGFAPIYREASMDGPELGPVRAALDAILRQQEPYPAVVMNRRWDITSSNDAARRFFGFLLGRPAGGPGNVLRMMFDPAALRPHVVNWESVAATLVQRAQREAVGGVADPEIDALLEEIFACPDVPRRLRSAAAETPLLPIIPVQFEKEGKAFHFFSTVTMLGTPQDITVQEIRIECFFPADRRTEELSRALAAQAEVAAQPT
jgi:transcriptional regulator with XRE-family HTH domain